MRQWVKIMMAMAIMLGVQRMTERARAECVPDQCNFPGCGTGEHCVAKCCVADPGGGGTPGGGGGGGYTYPTCGAGVSGTYAFSKLKENRLSRN